MIAFVRNCNNQLQNFLKISVECEDLRGIDIRGYINCLEKMHGKFILHEAASNGDLHLVKYLHQNGANLTAKNNKGSTPILLAAINGKMRVVNYLHKNAYHGLNPSYISDKKDWDNYPSFVKYPIYKFVRLW